MHLNDKTRLVVTEDRQTFIAASELIHEHMVSYAQHWHPSMEADELTHRVDTSKQTIHAYLAGLSNACDPSLRVAPEDIISLYMHTTLTHSVLCFLYKDAEGAPQNVGIRLDERLHRSQ